MKTSSTATVPSIIKKNELLADHSTFKVGGPARYFIEAKSLQDVETAFSFAYERGLKFFILGKGSNCLFDDKGFNGLVLLNKIEFLEKQSPETFLVGSGYPFSRLGTQTARWGLKGLEFASGIPGTVGGAVFMNAGANGSETCDYVKSVQFFDGKLHHFQRDELRFAYRSSPFHQMEGIITAVEFELSPCPNARKRQIAIIEKRKESQPLQDASAGCAFRNPDGSHSGKLIEESGLKGFSIGGAMVSEKHANFIINSGLATAKDVIALIMHIKETVYKKTGIDLYPEVKIIPYE